MTLQSRIAWSGADLIYGFLSRILWPRCSAAAIVVRDNELLAIDMKDYLMLPAGGLEYGERFEEAAVRETFEETGYRVEILGEITEDINSVGGTEVIFSAELVGEEPEHSGSWGEPVWIDLDKVKDRNWRHNRDMKVVLDAKQS